ncbi:peroxin-16, partial [Phenoliferia sp. Uapishka_3]
MNAVITAGRSYESMLVKNATRISSIESSLRSLTWFLPGRFKDSELASEALYSFLNILGVYHDSVLHKTISTLPPSLRPPPSSHARYTRHWTSTSPSYASLSRSLQIISCSSLLLEMFIRKRRGSAAAERAIIAIEGLKAFLRLALMRTTKGRTGLNPAVPEREVDPSVLDLHSPRVVGDPPNARVELEDEGSGEYWTGKTTGQERSTIKGLRGEEKGKVAVQEYLKRRVLTVENARRPEDLVAKARGLGKAAEVTWILRPLIYVIAMKHYGRRHTLPYLLSLALEYLAYSLRKNAAQRRAFGKASGPMLPTNPASEAERAETKKRANAFWCSNCAGAPPHSPDLRSSSIRGAYYIPPWSKGFPKAPPSTPIELVVRELPWTLPAELESAFLTIDIKKPVKTVHFADSTRGGESWWVFHWSMSKERDMPKPSAFKRVK